MKKRPTVFPAQAGSGRLCLSEDDSYERGAVLWTPAAQGAVGEEEDGGSGWEKVTSTRA